MGYNWIKKGNRASRLRAYTTPIPFATSTNYSKAPIFKKIKFKLWVVKEKFLIWFGFTELKG